MKALAAHGGMKQPAFAGRGAPAYRTLEAVGLPGRGVKSRSAARGAVATARDEAGRFAAAPEVKSPLPAVPPPAAPPKFGEDARPTILEVRNPNPDNTGAAVDEFDPSIYNRGVNAKPK